MIRQMVNVIGFWNVVAGGVAIVLAFLLWLWWYETHTFFHEFAADSVIIAGDEYDVTHWQGVDASGSPLNMRACFVISRDVQAPPALDPMPSPAPAWFRCFNSDYIIGELGAGKGKAYIAQSNEFPGIDRIVAVLDGGRVFMWRQPNGS